MLKASLGSFLLAETGKSIWRNKLSSFLSVATTAFALFLLAVSFLININLNYMFQVAQGQMEIQAYLKRGLSEDDVNRVMQQIKNLAGVSQVKYVSPDDALNELREMFRDKPSVLEGLEKDNPLPASIRVKMSDASRIPNVASQIRNMDAVEDVIYQQEAYRRLASLGRVSQILSLAGVLVVGLVAVMVIGNSIKLTIDAKRHEIAIMKLVGATDELIMGPFLLQGLVFGIVGGLLAALMAAALYVWFLNMVQSAVPFLPVLRLTFKSAMDMLGIVSATGIIVGTLGSVLSLRRYLEA